MSSVVNKNAAITAQNESNSSTKSSLRKWAERSLMLMAVLGTVIVCMLYGDSFSYKVGSTVRHFDFVGKQHTEMKLDARAHYLPVFRLEGHAGIAVR
ncbi:DUF2850 domain-containing protein [Vibrio parahaemolyticus]|uniref:DUF2850 domain-containing protein n=1 Tax=Vibrio parahaemolyticus TaxID=670 RepID=UPI00111F93A5|nr:DUF2850 domain-containing protein [Vibrio parahaemolyticus]TOG61468.1 hypothetical protein CGI97_07330 [Vibrio parahaemolyticus]TOG72384.1 hypothetical protein CGI98_10995 [Vibrio parahaemolyticus]